MLKNIPSILSPELLCALSQMGHGDELVIADGNFPSHSVGKNAIVIRADGHGVPELLDAILQVLPLDTYTEKPVGLMAVCEGDDVETPIWDKYNELLNKHEPDHHDIEFIERFEFYERAKGAYLIIATGEQALYANILLKKGVVV